MAAPDETDARPVALAARNITVRYGSVVALRNVDFSVHAGSVHALVGENGAGKSTLMRVLSGAIIPEAGGLERGGVPVAFQSPRDAQRAGIRMIHQELSLVSALSVAENIFLGREPSRHGWVDRRLMGVRARAMLERLGEDIDPGIAVGKLSLARREMVEIAKALAESDLAEPASHARGPASVLILDEPTAILSLRETETLFREIARLAGAGMAIVYCSHRLDEIAAVADTVTVLRDGMRVAVGAVATTRRSQLIQLMVGRPAETTPPTQTPTPITRRRDGLRVAHLSSAQVHDVSFHVDAGEVVAFVGLVGAGRTELTRALIGADRRTTGTVTLAGRPLEPRSPRDAVRAGVGYVPEDRKRSALIAEGSVRQNMTLARLLTFARGPLVPFVARERERMASASWATALRIGADSVERRVMRLSGGNQQKVVLARWLMPGDRPLDLLIVDEPTRGVDVGVRAEIYAVLRNLAAQGTAIIAVTSDLEEALTLGERLLVMREGRIVGTLAGAARTATAVASLMVPA